jgi:hypothetical protein
MTNFVIGKLGLSCRFNWPEHNTGWFSAADDISRLIVNLSYNNPEDNFYIIGNNDLHTLSSYKLETFFPHNNVYNTYNTNRITGERYHYEAWKTPLEYLNENSINIDYGIVAFGSVLNKNVPNKTYTKKGTIAKPLDRAVKYVAPYVHTLNELGIEWISLVDDPRHFYNKIQDLWNKPKLFLSQVEGIHDYECIQSYENQTLETTKIPIKYSYVEKNIILDEIIEPISDSWKSRKQTVSLVCNQAGTDEKLISNKKLSNGCRPRYPIIKEWILDPFESSVVYGKWADEIMQSNYDAFKGTLNRKYLYSEMKNWKHSLCIPIDKGWATAKYLECLKCGISPFLHPDYDSQKNTNMTEYFRVSSVEEFKDKINNKEDVHIEEIRKAQELCLSDHYVSGQYLNDEIYSTLGLERNIQNKVRDLWTPKEQTSLSNFF